MPISTKCLINQSNSCLAGSPSELNLAQVSGIKTSNTVYSVANTSVLPVASCNKGRMIFVEDISAYRYSDGFEWTNSYCSAIANNGAIYASGRYVPLLTIGNASSPVRELTISDWKQISSVQFYGTVAGLKSDSTLWSMGFDAFGVLGVNTCNVNQRTPVQEITSSTWLCISGTAEDMLGIKCDGTLWGWGRNIATLGDGAYNTNRSSPVQELCSDSTWCHIGAGGRNVAAIKSSGTLWTWGCNGAGEVGGTCSSTFPTTSPVQEPSLSSNWAFSAAGSETLRNHIIGIKSDGTAWLWGMNDFGHLGVNSKVCYSSPVQEITSSSDWCFASLGSDTSLGLKTDGTLWAWGANNVGQLGVNNTISHSSPVQEITSSTNWVVSSAAMCISSALKTDGTLWAWGYNFYGTLGDGTNVCRSSPVQEITSSTDWVCNGIAASQHTLFAINQETKGFNEP